MRQKHYRRNEHDCLTQCVARLLNVHPETVPLFIAKGKNWVRYFKRWCKARGLGMQHGYWRPDIWRKSDVVIAVGRTRARTWHAVLYKGKKPWFDPAYRKKPFITPEPQYVWMPYRVGRKAPKTIPAKAKP